VNLKNKSDKEPTGIRSEEFGYMPEVRVGAERYQLTGFGT
jgi:hypothetical protein